MDGIEPFADFLARVRAARPDQFPGAACTAAEFERMRRRVLDHYRGIRVVRSFASPGGRPVDCIPFDDLPTVRTARALGHEVQVIPPPPPLPEAGATPPVPAPPTPGPCPPGAVAWPRLTLEELTRHEHLEGYFRKGTPPPAGPP